MKVQIEKKGKLGRTTFCGLNKSMLTVMGRTDVLAIKFYVRLKKKKTTGKLKA